MKHTYPLKQNLTDLGPLRQWQVEWNWQGEKVRLHIESTGAHFTESSGTSRRLSSRSESLLASLPEGTVLEGIVLNDEQETFIAWDCIVFLGTDITTMPLYTRQLQAFPMIGSLESPRFRTSEPLEVRTWEVVEEILAHPGPPGTSGLVLKKTDSLYHEEDLSSSWWTLPTS